jgi:hypothetical protein
MAIFIFILVMFTIFVGGGWLLGKLFGGFLFPDREEKDRNVFIDKSVHHHYHEHKNISIIDDVTKKKIFELKDQN